MFPLEDYQLPNLDSPSIHLIRNSMDMYAKFHKRNLRIWKWLNSVVVNWIKMNNWLSGKWGFSFSVLFQLPKRFSLPVFQYLSQPAFKIFQYSSFPIFQASNFPVFQYFSSSNRPTLQASSISVFQSFNIPVFQSFMYSRLISSNSEPQGSKIQFSSHIAQL